MSENDEVAVGEKGEILVRGPNVMTKYWGDAEATRELHLPAAGFTPVMLGTSTKKASCLLTGVSRT